MQHYVILTVGDWSDDGHGKSNKHFIRSTLTRDNIESAYMKGTVIIGFDLNEDCCAEYEDGQLDNEIVEKLKNAGFFVWKQNTFDLYEELKSDGFVDPELFFDMYMYIVKLGDPSFEYEEFDDIPIHLGGYGCFGS